MGDHVAAFRRERADLLNFCATLSPAEWQAPSRAAGWRVQDVIAHLGASCRLIFTPAAAEVLRSNEIERANDVLVDQRRNWSPDRVVAEYTSWSRRFARLAGIVSQTPLRTVKTRVGELGAFQMGQVLPGALLFDHHTHLRHDLAPAVNRTAPGTDPERLAGTVEWMVAVLSNQLRSAPPTWLPGPVVLNLRGPGGGRWHIRPDGSLLATATVTDSAAAEILSDAALFPLWGTQRANWRDTEVSVRGSHDDATVRLLDAINVV